MRLIRPGLGRVGKPDGQKSKLAANLGVIRLRPSGGRAGRDRRADDKFRQNAGVFGKFLVANGPIGRL